MRCSHQLCPESWEVDPKNKGEKKHEEGGNRSESNQPNIQRYSSGKKMHCSICRQPEHRCTKCPNKPSKNNAKSNVTNDTSEEANNVDPETHPAEESRADQGVSNAPSKRPKLQE